MLAEIKIIIWQVDIFRITPYGGSSYAEYTQAGRDTDNSSLLVQFHGPERHEPLFKPVPEKGGIRERTGRWHTLNVLMCDCYGVDSGNSFPARFTLDPILIATDMTLDIKNRRIIEGIDTVNFDNIPFYR